jgi:putative FmdB family regulatory protein
MPFYAFRCQPCEAVFTIRATMQEKEAGLQPVCPACQATETRPVITAGILLGQVAEGNCRPSPACGCGSGSGSGCCG